LGLVKKDPLGKMKEGENEGGISGKLVNFFLLDDDDDE
jgi:hypothetical protein